MSPEPKVPARPKRPKPRIPLPLKPGKVMDEDKIYRRKPKHRKKSEPGSG